MMESNKQDREISTDRLPFKSLNFISLEDCSPRKLIRDHCKMKQGGRRERITSKIHTQENSFTAQTNNSQSPACTANNELTENNPNLANQITQKSPKPVVLVDLTSDIKPKKSNSSITSFFKRLPPSISVTVCNKPLQEEVILLEARKQPVLPLGPNTASSLNKPNVVFTKSIKSPTVVGQPLSNVTRTYNNITRRQLSFVKPPGDLQVVNCSNLLNNQVKSTNSNKLLSNKQQSVSVTPVQPSRSPSKLEKESKLLRSLPEISYTTSSLGFVSSASGNFPKKIPSALKPKSSFPAPHRVIQKSSSTASQSSAPYSPFNNVDDDIISLDGPIAVSSPLSKVPRHPLRQLPSHVAPNSYNINQSKYSPKPQTKAPKRKASPNILKYAKKQKTMTDVLEEEIANFIMKQDFLPSMFSGSNDNDVITGIKTNPITEDKVKEMKSFGEPIKPTAVKSDVTEGFFGKESRLALQTTNLSKSKVDEISEAVKESVLQNHDKKNDDSCGYDSEISENESVVIESPTPPAGEMESTGYESQKSGSLFGSQNTEKEYSDGAQNTNDCSLDIQDEESVLCLQDIEPTSSGTIQDSESEMTLLLPNTKERSFEIEDDSICCLDDMKHQVCSEVPDNKVNFSCEVEIHEDESVLSIPGGESGVSPYFSNTDGGLSFAGKVDIPLPENINLG